MAFISKPLVMSMKDQEGDVLRVEMRHMATKDFVEYNAEKFDYSQKGKRVAMYDRSAEVKLKWFDKLCKKVEWVYKNANGEKVPFSTEHPIPQDELKRIAEELGLNGEVKSQMDIIPQKFKVDTMTYLYDSVELDADEELKKK